MDNDLISKSKLFEWIKVELEKEYPDSVAQYVDGRETVLEILRHRIEQGVFSPDPIPLPTIKPGDKVIHSEHGVGIYKGVHSAREPEKVICKFDGSTFDRLVNLDDLEVSHD